MQREYVGDLSKISELKNRTLYQYYSDLDYKHRQIAKENEIHNRANIR
jgi:hypothetical protein